MLTSWRTYKGQIITASVALVAIVGLSFLPKSVVDSDNKTIGGANRDGKATTDSPAVIVQDSSVVSLHRAELSPQQKTSLDKWKKNFTESGSAGESKIALDSLAEVLRTVNQYDSVAHYTALFANKNPSPANALLAGDAYYEAFTFAVDNTKGQAMSQQARNWYQQILDKDPTRPDVRVKLGMTYVASETPMKGIQLIREVLKEDPDNKFALLNLGLLSMQSGQMDKAKERFEQLLALDASDTKAMFYLAVTQAELGKTDEARKLFEKVRRLDKDPALQQSINSYLQDLNGRKP